MAVTPPNPAKIIPIAKSQKTARVWRERFEFTNQNIEQLPLGTYRKYYDTIQPCLSVRSLEKIKTFYVKKPGERKQVSIGRFPGFAVEEAREAAARILAGLNTGDSSPSFGYLFTEYIDNHMTLHRKSAQECEGLYRRYFKNYANKPILDFSAVELQQMHRRIGENHGKTAANRALELFSVVFNRARRMGLIPATAANPNAAITKFRLPRRTRFLNIAESKRLYETVLKLENPVLRDFILTLWFSAQRFSEIRYLRWQYVDLDLRIIEIPDTKNGLTQFVPITQPVLDILVKRKEQSDPNCLWVFPAPFKQGQPIHLNTKCWRLIKDAAKIPDIRIHDLRRTTASMMSIGNTSIPIISQALNHRDIKSTMIYARLNIDPVREHVSKAINLMLPHLAGEST